MHALTLENIEGFSVKFYDWAAFHPTNARLKRNGQWLNHVTVSLWNAAEEWEFVVTWDGAEWRRSDVVARTFNRPVFSFSRRMAAKYSYRLADGVVTTRTEYDPWEHRLPWINELILNHKTSPTWYHYLYWYTGRILPEPKNCLTLTKTIVNRLFGWTDKINETDTLGLLKQINYAFRGRYEELH